MEKETKLKIKLITSIVMFITTFWFIAFEFYVVGGIFITITILLLFWIIITMFN